LEKFSQNEIDFGKIFAIDKNLASVLSWKAFYDVFSYLKGFAAITRRLQEKASASFGNISYRMRQNIKLIASRAFDDFQIRHMIEK